MHFEQTRLGHHSASPSANTNKTASTMQLAALIYVYLASFDFMPCGKLDQKTHSLFFAQKILGPGLVAIIVVLLGLAWPAFVVGSFQLQPASQELA